MAGWKKIYSSPKIERYIHENSKNIIEMYPEKIDKKKKWFLAVITKSGIADREFDTKKEAKTLLDQLIK